MLTEITSFANAYPMAIIAAICLVVAKWKIFTKMGVKGWKALIPVYSDFILYDKVWDKKMFLASWGIIVAGIVTNFLSFKFIHLTMFDAIDTVLLFAGFLITIGLNYKIAKAFGFGKKFTVGLLLLNSIFMLILGFGKSEYQTA